MRVRNRKPAWPWVWVLLGILALSVSGSAAGAMDRPSYAAGDRWVYELEGALDGLPGLDTINASVSSLTLLGRVDVEIRGPVERSVRGVWIRGVEVSTSGSGFLSGTFSIPVGGSNETVSVAGSFASDAVEVWEDRGYFAVESEGTSEYVADVSLVLTTRLTAHARFHANTTVEQDSVFPLEEGETATATLDTELTANQTVTVLGQVVSWENDTAFASAWSRTVLGRETITVAAGTFEVYKLNQTLGFFPGVGISVPIGGGNETAYWSNEVGTYVKRVAYVNGSAVAEMRLKSVSLGPPGWPLSTVLIVVGVPAILAAAVLVVFLRRRKRKTPSSREEPPAPEGSGTRTEGNRAR